MSSNQGEFLASSPPMNKNSNPCRCVLTWIAFDVQSEWQAPEWLGTLWRDDEMNAHPEQPPPPPLGLGKISEQKGILGPGPADLRFSEAL